MFDFFKKKEYVMPEKVTEDVSEKEPEVNIYEPAHYTIGLNKHGMTQIIFRSHGGLTTLSMDAVGVRHFVKMLECTLDEPSGKE